MLVLVGDTVSSLVSPQDRSVALLFGDAGSATAVESVEASEPLSTFLLYGDGAGKDNIIVPAGGFRSPLAAVSAEPNADSEGNIRAATDFYMNGMNVFLFSMQEIPRLLKDVVAHSSYAQGGISYYLLHQANRFIISYIIEKTSLDSSRVPINIHRFGNTSGASIPLLICDELHAEATTNTVPVVMAGFGTGFSWGGAVITLDRLTCAELLYL